MDSSPTPTTLPMLTYRGLWEGTMGDKPYPTGRSGLDLRQHRDALLLGRDRKAERDRFGHRR